MNNITIGTTEMIIADQRYRAGIYIQPIDGDIYICFDGSNKILTKSNGLKIEAGDILNISEQFYPIKAIAEKNVDVRLQGL